METISALLRVSFLHYMLVRDPGYSFCSQASVVPERFLVESAWCGNLAIRRCGGGPSARVPARFQTAKTSQRLRRWSTARNGPAVLGAWGEPGTFHRFGCSAQNCSLGSSVDPARPGIGAVLWNSGSSERLGNVRWAPDLESNRTRSF